MKKIKVKLGKDGASQCRQCRKNGVDTWHDRWYLIKLTDHSSFHLCEAHVELKLDTP